MKTPALDAEVVLSSRRSAGVVARYRRTERIVRDGAVLRASGGNAGTDDRSGGQTGYDRANSYCCNKFASHRHSFAGARWGVTSAAPEEQRFECSYESGVERLFPLAGAGVEGAHRTCPPLETRGTRIQTRQDLVARVGTDRLLDVCFVGHRCGDESTRARSNDASVQAGCSLTCERFQKWRTIYRGVCRRQQ